MTDYRSIIERDLSRVGPADFGLEQLARRRGRKRRLQQVGTVAVAIAIAAASLGIASRLLRRPEKPPPAVPSPETTPGIWTVDVETRATSLVWGPEWLREGPASFTGGNMIGAPDVTADGSRVVVTVGRRSADFQIHTVNTYGGTATRITDCERPFHCPLSIGYSGPRWSPDGSAIAFVGGPNTRENASDVYVMDANGDHLRLVTHVAGEQDVVDWSPDGKEIVFDSESSTIFRASVADGSTTRLTRGGSTPLWSPDDRWIAFVGDEPRRQGIWLMRPDGTEPTFLVPGFMTLAWSPDGRELIVEQAGPDTLVESREIVRTHRYAVIDVDTGRSRTFDVRAIEGAWFLFRWPGTQT